MPPQCPKDLGRTLREFTDVLDGIPPRENAESSCSAAAGFGMIVCSTETVVLRPLVRGDTDLVRESAKLRR